MTREQFMEFFRNDDTLNTLSADDRIEIFTDILLGDSDISESLLQNLCDNYNTGFVVTLTKYDTEEGHQ